MLERFTRAELDSYMIQMKQKSVEFGSFWVLQKEYDKYLG